MKYSKVPTLWATAFAAGCGSQTDVNNWKISSPVITDGAEILNYTYTLTRMLDHVSIGKVQLNAVSSALSAEAPVPVDMKALVFPAGTVPAP